MQGCSSANTGPLATVAGLGEYAQRAGLAKRPGDPFRWLIVDGDMKGIDRLIRNSPSQAQLGLRHAVELKMPNMVELMFSYGATVEQPPSPYESWMLLACRGTHSGPDSLAIVNLLVAKGAPIDHKDPQGRTPLSETAAYNRADLVEILLKHGADPNSADKRKNTPLHVVMRGGARPMTGLIEIVKMLLAHGADPEAKNDNGATPLSMVQKHPFTWPPQLVGEVQRKLEEKASKRR